MTLPFKINEFTVLKEVPVAVADKIVAYHIAVVFDIVQKFNGWITVKNGGGYNPPGSRCLDSVCNEPEHSFEHNGAVDWMCAPERMDDLIYYLVLLTPYKRLIVHREHNFIHCDYEGQGRWIHEMKNSKILSTTEVVVEK